MSKRIKVILTKAGTAYDASKAYKLLDYIVVDNTTMYVCKRVDKDTMTCVGHALTETDYWDKCIDMADAIKKVNDAVATATTATATANKATKAANDAAATATTATTNANKAVTDAKAATDKANTSATQADTATQQATDAATAAERVNASLDGSTLTVTDRTGKKSSLALAEQAEVNGKIENLQVRVDALSHPNEFVGFTRVNGDASGDATTTYGDASLLHDVASEWKLATVKNGVVTHVAAPGRLTLDENGEEMKFDGSDGDVMVINRNAHLLKATKTIDGKELNLIGIGKTPASWYGVTSKKLPAFGMTPCETTQGKIFDDVRSQSHCVYNTSVNGSYGVPNGIFKASYIGKNAPGYTRSSQSAIISIQNAQAKNADANTARPYMGWYYETYEALLATMFAELGSLKHTEPTSFGCGFTKADFSSDNFNDAAISGTSGWNFIMPDGTNKYKTLYANVCLTNTSNPGPILTGVNGGIGGYTFVQLLEGQRILDGIAKAGLTDKIGVSTNIFSYGDDGSVVCSSDGSINLTTGAGMEDLKFYYVVRNVPKCEGMADGVMTAVVNRYVKLQVSDGVYWDDKKTPLKGAAAVLKASIPIYRGFTLPMVGYYRQMSYAYYTIHNVDGNLSVDFRCAERMEDVQPLTEFTQAAYNAAYGSLPLLIKDLPLKYDVPVASNFAEQWAKSSNYSLSLFCHKAGGGYRSYENAYWLINMSNNNGANTSQVHGSAVGCVLSNGNASARSAVCDNHAGNGWSGFAGAFAVLLK